MRGAPTFLSQLPASRSALEFAYELHRGQHRDSDGAPFILHPLEVAALLHSIGFEDHVVATGILHDTIENSGLEVAGLVPRFGEIIAEMVFQLSDDPSISDYSERKAALRRQVEGSDLDTACVYAADKITKVRELRARISGRRLEALEGTAEQRAKYRHYVASLLMIERVLGDHTLARQLRFELEALSALPPDRDAPRLDQVEWSVRMPGPLVELSRSAHA